MSHGSEALDQRTALLRSLSQSLARSVTAFEQTEQADLRTFPDYKKSRAAYLEIQALIFMIGERAGEIPTGAPADLRSWLVRMRLRAVATFTRISLKFFRNPPALLIQALGAYEILEQELEAFDGVLKIYDMLLLEAALDDKTADELDLVRVQMEEVVGLLSQLLKTAPPPLTIF